METTSATTKNNVQVVQQGFNEFLKGNIAGILTLCTEDVKWDTYKVPNAPFTGSFSGKEGVQQYFYQTAQTIQFTSFQPKEFIANANRVMVLGNNSGTVKATGKSFDVGWCCSFLLREGKITEFFFFTDSYDIYKNFQE